MIERGIESEGRVMTVREIDRMTTDFIDYYASHIAVASRPFEGLEHALDGLTEKGCRLAVCTNKLEWLSLKLLKALKLSQRFAAICGPDTFGVQKPNPKVFQQTVLRAGGEPGRAIMIGDSKTDIHTGRAAQVPVVAVDFGYTDVPIANLLPDRIISTFSELPAAISALLALQP